MLLRRRNSLLRLCVFKQEIVQCCWGKKVIRLLGTFFETLHLWMSRADLVSSRPPTNPVTLRFEYKVGRESSRNNPFGSFGFAGTNYSLLYKRLRLSNFFDAFLFYFFFFSFISRRRSLDLNYFF